VEPDLPVSAANFLAIAHSSSKQFEKLAERILRLSIMADPAPFLPIVRGGNRFWAIIFKK
jgi:hypothetical protein